MYLLSPLMVPLLEKSSVEDYELKQDADEWQYDTDAGMLLL